MFSPVLFILILNVLRARSCAYVVWQPGVGAICGLRCLLGRKGARNLASAGLRSICMVNREYAALSLPKNTHTL